MGLSPRGRGSPGSRPLPISSCGSIPAWAGEPEHAQRGVGLFEVYPRVGGGAPARASARLSFRGLSPRGRGSQTGRPADPSAAGSIPAWAGEPSGICFFAAISGVYPRVGGGALSASVEQRRELGLSPRGRGSLHAARTQRDFPGSIPAWAGEPAACCRRAASCRVYPRVGGGAAAEQAHQPAGEGLSPRGRGSQRGRATSGQVLGSIPAWAGEPRAPSRLPRALRVYPRVGGGALFGTASGPTRWGLSPRGRGSLLEASV